MYLPRTSGRLSNIGVFAPNNLPNIIFSFFFFASSCPFLAPFHTPCRSFPSRFAVVLSVSGHVIAVICTAAILLDPLGAFFVGGVGAFLGDFFFYPAPMFVSLVTHGLQAVVVSLCAHKLSKEHRGRAALVGVILGLIINVAVYYVGRDLVYATP